VTPALALAALAALVLLATALGLVHRARLGRVRRTADDAPLVGELGTDAVLGRRATLVQLSTPTCAQCPATARLLADVAGAHDGVAHVEVDLSRHPAVADRFRVQRTPTTLLVDADRRVRARIGGPPRRDALEDELLTVLGGDRAR
jgi:thiol-disulfide isomerase/thioredoxin